MRLKPLDFVAVIAAVLAVVAVSVFAYGNGAEASRVSVQSEDGEYLYPLAEDRHLDVAGPIGDTHVEIVDGRARVVSSPCRDQICVAAGWLESTGDWTACLPNRVFVRVQGGERSDGIDAQTF